MQEFRLFGKEHYELMDNFEKQYKKVGRIDREGKSMWPKQTFYENGEINKLFLAYSSGYSLSKDLHRQ